MNEQKRIALVYAVLGSSLIFGFVPHAAFALLSLGLFTAALVAAYLIRKQHVAASLTRDHMSYLIRTIWMSGGIAFGSLIAASIYILCLFDPEPVRSCADQMMSFGDAGIIEACLKNFVELNFTVFMTGTAIAAAPIVSYLVWKIGNGVTRLSKSQSPPSKYRNITGSPQQ